MARTAKRRPKARRAAAGNQVLGLLARPLNLLLCVGLAIVTIVVIDAIAPDAARTLLIDRFGDSWPITVQNVMWCVFFIGLGQLLARLKDAISENGELHQGYLPEDERTILQAPDLPEIYGRARAAVTGSAVAGSDGRFLPRLIQRVVTQFQTSHSVEQSNALLNTSLELFLHEIDLRYSMIRYIAWLIPTLGFIGTVIGISLALAYAGEADFQDPSLLAELTRRLAVAFNTTLLALVMSSVLILMQHMVQAREERALNRAGQYCLDNLINRLYDR